MKKFESLISQESTKKNIWRKLWRKREINFGDQWRKRNNLGMYKIFIECRKIKKGGKEEINGLNIIWKLLNDDNKGGL